MMYHWGNVIHGGTTNCLRHIFITGELPVPFHDSLSDLNGVKDLTMCSLFEDVVGFTRADVVEALRQIPSLTEEQRAENAERIQAQYGGYRFVRPQSAPLCHSTGVLHYLAHLREFGVAPVILLDSNMAQSVDKVAQFLLRNFHHQRDDVETGQPLSSVRGAKMWLPFRIHNLRQRRAARCCVL